MEEGVAKPKAELDSAFITKILKTRNLETMASPITRENGTLGSLGKTIVKPAIFMSDDRSFASCGTNIETVKIWREST